MNRKTTLEHWNNLTSGDSFCVTLGKYRFHIIYFIAFKNNEGIFFDGNDSNFFKYSREVINGISSLVWEDTEKNPPLDYIETLPEKVHDSLVDAVRMLGNYPIENRNPFKD